MNIRIWLRSMFANVVETYDLLNCMLTLGLDEIWRRVCAKECASGNVILDLCCGTGDLTLHISRYSGLESHVLGVDFNKGMLYRAVNKKVRAERKERYRIKNGQDKIRVNTYNVSFILADAAYLPLKVGCIDRIGISFSFRNLVYRNPSAKFYLKEVLRTLHPKGKFVCLETSQPRHRPLRVLYHLYLRKVVPLIGWLVSRRKGAYRYLGISATNFASGAEITKMLLNAGFHEASFKPMALGVVGIHIAIR